MPRGTRHVLIGTLRRTRFGHALEMDGGGVWQLDLGWSSAKRHFNQRVTVEGTRSASNRCSMASPSAASPSAASPSAV